MLPDKPLSARSVLLSLLLGSPDAGMTASELVRVGDHLGLTEAAVRVALTRAVARGDLRRSGTTYRLGERLLERRRRQQEQETVPAWDGTWEMAVVAGPARSGRDRAALRALLAGARLAELREGVWTRPANLSAPRPGTDGHPVHWFLATPQQDPRDLAASLWDLDGWREEALAVLARLGRAEDPSERLAVAAHLVRLLGADPLLPTELLPQDWPAPRARQAYADYQRSLHLLARST